MFEYNNTIELKRLTILHSAKISEIAVMHEAEREEIIETLTNTLERSRKL